MSNPYQRAISHFGETAQKEKAIEELKELIDEIWDEMMKENYDKSKMLGEIADVLNMIESLKLIFGFSGVEVEMVMKHKMQRTMQRIDKELAERK